MSEGLSQMSGNGAIVCGVFQVEVYSSTIGQTELGVKCAILE